jgi:hypothetical protein
MTSRSILDGPFAALMNLTARKQEDGLCTITSTTRNIDEEEKHHVGLIAATASSRLISQTEEEHGSHYIAIQTSTLCLPTRAGR